MTRTAILCRHTVSCRISPIKESESALKDSEERYKYLFENSGVGFGYYTTDGIVISYNRKALENVGGTLEDYVGKSVLDIFPPPEGETFYNRIQLAISTDIPQVYEDYLIFRGEAKWFSSTITRITDASGHVIGVQIALLDITNRKIAEEALSESQALLKAAFENSQAGIAIADAPDGKLRYVNKAGLLIRNKSENEIVKNVDIRNYVDSWQILHFDGSPYEDDKVPLARAVLYGESCSDEFIVRRDNMEDRYVLANAAPIKNSAGEITAGMVVFLDITEKRKAEEEINFLAYHDHLTNVFNRRYFEDEFVRLNGEANFPIAIITGDLNGLKLINDSIGHAAGDEAIMLFAASIREQIRGKDILARVAGDEFGVILPQYSDEEASLLVSRLQSTIRIKLNDSQTIETQIELSATFGYSVQTFVGQTLDSLMNEAETFMYRRKFYEDASKHSHVIDAIMNTLFEKSVREQQHSIRVSILAAAIAEAMQFDEASIAKVKAAGALHDIGKIGIDERILNKTERLTELEWNLMKQHPVRSARILATIDAYLDIVPFVKSHHERYDGLGYPSGLSSTQIPLEARIICVADAFDAMTKVRPYRSPVSKESAAEELVRCAGSHFDPQIVTVFTEKVLPQLDMLAGLIQ
ncbi:MAG: diguanylate cyclase [Eubacteriales bacterium]